MPDGGTIQTKADYEALPGVVECLRATPAGGHVTLRVRRSAIGLAAALNGSGRVPLGCVVHEEVVDD